MSWSIRMFRRSSRASSRNNQPNYSTQSRRFKEKNILSAMLGTATIVVLCASLVEPMWFRIEGSGKCCHTYLGVNIFFGNFGGEFKKSTSGINCDDISDSDQNLFEYCVNSKAVTLIQVIIIFCIMAICSSLFSFVLDIIGPNKKTLWRVSKRYAFGYICTVLLCTTTIGFCYWASQEIYSLQLKYRHSGSKVRVSYDTGIYLVTAAGGIAILATASNLMRRYPTEEEEQAEILLEEESDDETDTAWSNITSTGVPPPYAP